MIGVVASTKDEAGQLIDELGLLGARALANHPRSARGCRLRAVFIDAGAVVNSETYSCLECASQGRVYRLERILNEHEWRKDIDG